MKHLLLFIATTTLLVGCAKTEEQKANECMQRIDSLYAQGKYSETLDSIVALRDHHPTALEARRKALVVWQNASLKMAQADVAKTDILLQQTTAQLTGSLDRLTYNRLRVRRDSLQARYEAMCGVVRMIHIRQKQNKK